jgi:hypothetical protein
MTFPSGLAVHWTTRVVMLLDINMFQGRRVDPNSIFLNEAKPRRRQMDVWSQRSADHRKRFKKVGALKGRKTKPPEYSRKVRGNLRFPLDFTYHGCPVETLTFKE